MKNSLLQCLSTYIWISNVPTNTQTVKLDNPASFFVGCLGQKTCDQQASQICLDTNEALYLQTTSSIHVYDTDSILFTP